MKIYQVGGSVRDELLGLPVKDRDFVVVGATPAEMIAKGFKPVGRDFPVFLHPETHEEYALARTERKHGRGHQGFVFHAAPDVSLAADLARRDLTINAMARDDSGALIDPYGGQRDLAAKVLRHVSPAFGEDPLRVLRVARFAARFSFPVADETLAMMRGLVERGELRDLSPERVWQEFSRGLMESRPSQMLEVLRSCGALAEIAPELDRLYRPDADNAQAGPAVLMETALDFGAARATEQPLPVQYAIASRLLAEDDAAALAARLRAATECRDAAINAARHAGTLERAATLDAGEWLGLLTGIDALRRPERLDVLVAVCTAYSAARRAAEAIGQRTSGVPARHMPVVTAGREPEAGSESMAARAAGAMRALSSVSYASLDIPAGGDVAAEVRRRRLAALDQWLQTSAS